MDSIVTFNVFASEADSEPKTIDLATLRSPKRIGSGKHGVVYRACLTFEGEKEELVALKMFKHWVPTTLEIESPFDRELAAYKRILEDEENQKDCPVIKARGWFILPRQNVLVLVKDLIEPRTDGLPLLHDNITEASPNQVMEWFGRLIILGIYIPDLNLTNFLDGKIADMSSAVILRECHPKLAQQANRLKRIVLQNSQWIQYRAVNGGADSELLWASLQKTWEQPELGRPAIKADGSVSNYDKGEARIM